MVPSVWFLWGDHMFETERPQPDWWLIAESIPHIVWMSAPDGATEYLNRRGTDYTGRPAEAINNWDWLALVHPDDGERARAAWESAVLTETAYEVDVRMRRVDGVFRWHTLRSLPVRGVGGQVVTWISTATDVDDQKSLRLRLLQAEDRAVIDGRERAEEQELQSAVMSQVADGVYTQDSEGRLTYMNQAASRMLGWREDELQGKRVHEVIHFQRVDGTPIDSRDCSLLKGGIGGRLVRSGGEAFTRKDGSVFPVAYSSVPLRTGPGAEGIVVVFRDIGDPGASSNLIRLLIVDSHMVTEAFELLLNKQEGVEVVGTAATSLAAVADAVRLRPDVILVDYELPDLDGVATTRALRAAVPEASVILMKESIDDAVVADAIAAGCAGVLDKSRAWVELVRAVRAAYHGEMAISQADLQRVVPRLGDERPRGVTRHLTDREHQVLTCMADGLSNQAAAERLGVTSNTIRNHVQRILYKLNVHSKLEAVVVATQERRADDAHVTPVTS